LDDGKGIWPVKKLDVGKDEHCGTLMYFLSSFIVNPLGTI